MSQLPRNASRSHDASASAAKDTEAQRILDATDFRSGNVFCREGEYWTIAYAGTVFRLRDAKGLHYLAHLLQRPGERFPAAVLFAAVRGDAAEGAADAEQARTAVTKRIKAAIRKIAEHHPTLGYQFSRVIKTGRECVYLPDPGRQETWVL